MRLGPGPCDCDGSRSDPTSQLGPGDLGLDGAVNSLQHLQRGWVPLRHTLRAQVSAPALSYGTHRVLLLARQPDGALPFSSQSAHFPDPCEEFLQSSPPSLAAGQVLPQQKLGRSSFHAVPPASACRDPRAGCFCPAGPAKDPWGQRDLKSQTFGVQPYCQRVKRRCGFKCQP